MTGSAGPNNFDDKEEELEEDNVRRTTTTTTRRGGGAAAGVQSVTWAECWAEDTLCGKFITGEDTCENAHWRKSKAKGVQ